MISLNLLSYIFFLITLLRLTIINGQFETLKYLVQVGAKLHVIDNQQSTPSIKAVLISANQNSIMCKSIHIDYSSFITYDAFSTMDA
jgi:hypothetical protein